MSLHPLVGHDDVRAALARAHRNGTLPSALLLHGIYVDPDLHRCGIGSRLLGAAVQAAANDFYDGLVTKAQSDAVPFFESLGLERLPAQDPGSDYPYRFWFPTRRA